MASLLFKFKHLHLEAHLGARERALSNAQCVRATLAVLSILPTYLVPKPPTDCVTAEIFNMEICVVSARPTQLSGPAPPRRTCKGERKATCVSLPARVSAFRLREGANFPKDHCFALPQARASSAAAQTPGKVGNNSLELPTPKHLPCLLSMVK
jgi:hypothetical protein